MSKLAATLNFLLTFDGAVAGLAAAYAQMVPSSSTACHAVIVGATAVGGLLAAVNKFTGNAPPDGVK